MTDENIARSVLRQRKTAHASIISGRLPTIDELLGGSPFFKDSWQLDIRTWARTWVEVPRRRAAIGDLVMLLEVLRDTLSTDALAALYDVREAFGDDGRRIEIYLSTCADEPVHDARWQLGKHLISGHTWRRQAVSRQYEVAVALGLLSGRPFETMLDYCEAGLADLRRYASAQRMIDSADPDCDTAAVEDEDIVAARKLLNLVADKPEKPAGPALVVVPKLGEASGAAKKDIYKSWDGIAGSALPLVPRCDVAAARRRLVEVWPHAEHVIDTILADLAPRETVRFRPTLLVGEPGSGKTSLLRAIADAVGLPGETYNLAGMADSSLGGTSSQWNSARESMPLQLIKRSKSASVAVVWDEVEKASASRHNGSALDALLPLLEPSQASRFRDLALEVEVDLSMVSHFATANSIVGIPAPLRDRMRVLTMPEPGWQHLDVLTRQIVERIASERGVDPRWYADLAQDEIELVRAVWPGGSLRQLRRVVETIIDGRDRIIGRT